MCILFVHIILSTKAVSFRMTLIFAVFVVGVTNVTNDAYGSLLRFFIVSLNSTNRVVSFKKHHVPNTLALGCTG